MGKFQFHPGRRIPHFKRSFSLILFLIFFSFTSNAQNPVLEVGLRVQKSVNLYYENGVTARYSDERLLSRQLYWGLSYVTSRLGSAMGSNAIKQDNFIFSGTYYFRPKKAIQPFLGMNIGYFYADYEYAVFNDLPNTSVLLSPEAGLSYQTTLPLKIGASLGYNLITGNGIKGPGTIYPVYFQTSITWDVFNKKDNDENQS